MPIKPYLKFQCSVLTIGPPYELLEKTKVSATQPSYMYYWLHFNNLLS